MWLYVWFLQDYGQYWPEDEACECGPFVIEPVDINTTNNDLTIREMKLLYDPEVSSDCVIRDYTISEYAIRDYAISDYAIRD